MNTKIISFLFAAFILLSFDSTAYIEVKPAAKWVRLGSRLVDYKLDKDVINVGAKKGNFTKLKVQVTGGSLNMHKMVVHYMNGTKQDVNLKYNFKKGSGSRVIDINGGDRFIKKVVFVYDTKNLARAKAKVHLFGRR